MKTNYFTIHKNKNAKKAKYSKTYSKLELKRNALICDFFISEVEKLKNK